MASTLLGAVQNARLISNVSVNPTNGSTKELINVKGQGLFISAEISKQGGNNDLTFVELIIDGRYVVSVSIAALFNWGMTSQNSYGLQVFRSAVGIETVTIGYPVPLTFNKQLLLRVKVKESGVVQIVGNVVCTVASAAISVSSKITARKTSKTIAKKKKT
ncbi:MAG: hypothetical protein ACK5NK_14205 [Niabella sp.]